MDTAIVSYWPVAGDTGDRICGDKFYHLYRGYGDGRPVVPVVDEAFIRDGSPAGFHSYTGSTKRHLHPGV